MTANAHHAPRPAVKGLRFVIPMVLLAAIGAYWWLRPRAQHLPESYVSERSATLWSSMAQVKQAVATLRYGEKVGVLQRRGGFVEVRTPDKVTGWVEARFLVDAPVWQRREQLIEHARAMPEQARGHTRKASNVHIEPGRNAAIFYKLGPGVAVHMVGRAVAEWTPSSEEADQEQKSKKEDWYLVHGYASSGPGGEAAAAKTEGPIPIAGWLLARFVELDLPDAIRDYTSSAGLRVVAWFELNRVSDETGEKPQYLVAGARGPEGQPCDFTMLRVYTWGARRRRYETAYVESNLCGYLPIGVGKNAVGDPEFRFAAEGPAGKKERRYVMRQTIVRLFREGEPAHARRSRR